ncbi:hypothetical protein ACGYLO_10590 [Sulfitobacter sp. 1A13353]|uniref:hypothetical protein n=1 Tax=Sulfitobacter sp. 1A13353 TaxID=3368568 RepID=UPI0037476B0B
MTKKHNVGLDEKSGPSFSDVVKETPPLDRECQIKFMTEAPARHNAIVDRWKKDDEICAMLSARRL